ncbi:hypothetical protein GW17_00057861, partial [Ensete ventricosum]
AVRIPVNHRTGMYRPYRAVQGGMENLAASHRRPRAVNALARGRFFSRVRRRNVSPRGEKDQGDIASATKQRLIPKSTNEDSKPMLEWVETTENQDDPLLDEVGDPQRPLHFITETIEKEKAYPQQEEDSPWSKCDGRSCTSDLKSIKHQKAPGLPIRGPPATRRFRQRKEEYLFPRAILAGAPSLPVGRQCPCAVAVRGSRALFLPRGDKGRGDVTPFLFY